MSHFNIILTSEASSRPTLYCKLSFLTENTLHLHHRTNHLMQFMEIMLFIYEAYKIHKHNVRQDAEFLTFKQVRYICW